MSLWYVKPLASNLLELVPLHIALLAHHLALEVLPAVTVVVGQCMRIQRCLKAGLEK